MKRKIRTVIVFLLLGAIVNVAVAWSAEFVPSLWKVGYGFTYFPDDEARALWDSMKADDWPEDWGGVSRERSLTETEDQVGVRTGLGRPGIGRALHIFRLRHGFPMRSLEGFARIDRKTTDLQGGSETFYLIDDRLPYRPLFVGTLVNTAFYALVLWLPFFGIGVLRRRRRIRRGLCPSCGYPMGTSGVCTECGRELPKRSGALT
jgi:hypothetical protein